MEQIKGFQTKIDAIQTMVDQLKKGELTLSELNELEKNTRELHERSVILRYVVSKEVSSEVAKVVAEEKTIEKEVERVVETVAEETPTENTGFSFDLEAKETVDAPQEPVEFSLFEEKTTEILEKVEETTEKTEVIDEKEETPIIATTPSSSSFFDSVDLKSASENTFSVGKLHSLIGAFGLNERLRFINDLFDSDAEQFGEAIKQLDSRSDLNEAKETVNYFAKNNEWEAEDESVIDFLLLIQRRYA